MGGSWPSAFRIWLCLFYLELVTPALAGPNLQSSRIAREYGEILSTPLSAFSLLLSLGSSPQIGELVLGAQEFQHLVDYFQYIFDSRASLSAGRNTVRSLQTFQRQPRGHLLLGSDSVQSRGRLRPGPMRIPIPAASLAAALAASQVTRAGGMEIVDPGDYSLQFSMTEGATISFRDPSWKTIIGLLLVGIFSTQLVFYARLLAWQTFASLLEKLARLIVYMLGGVMSSDVLMIDAAVGLDEPENEPQAREAERPMARALSGELAAPPRATPRLWLCDCCGHHPATIQCRLCERRVCEVSRCYVPRCENCFAAAIEATAQFTRRQHLARCPPARDMQTQSQTTYTSLRGVANPRFSLTIPQFGCYTANGSTVLPVIHHDCSLP